MFNQFFNGCNLWSSWTLLKCAIKIHLQSFHIQSSFFIRRLPASFIYLLYVILTLYFVECWWALVWTILSHALNLYWIYRTNSPTAESNYPKTYNLHTQIFLNMSSLRKGILQPHHRCGLKLAAKMSIALVKSSI